MPALPAGRTRGVVIGNGCSVLVTGASSGIGLAIATALDRRGWTVFAGVRRDVDAERLRAILSARSEPVRLDVTVPDEISAAIARIGRATGGRLDALVNNAGIVVLGPFEALELRAWQDLYAVNVFGAVAVIRAALPLLRASRGRIANVGSISASSPWPFQSIYASSKIALRQIGGILRVELRPFGIRVAHVEPGVVRSAIWKKPPGAGHRGLDGLPTDLGSAYEAMFRAIDAASERIGARAPDAEAVVRAVAHALESRRPRERYTAGLDARLQRVVDAVVPHRVRERVVGFGIARIVRRPGASRRPDPR